MMKPSYFVSERVRLRAMEPEDLEIMYAMRMTRKRGMLRTSRYRIPSMC